MKNYLPFYFLLLLFSTGIYSNSVAQSSISEWTVIEERSDIDVLYKHVVTTRSFIVIKVINKTDADVELELQGAVNYENYPDEVAINMTGIKISSLGEVQGNENNPETDLDNQLVIDISAVNDAPIVKLLELKIL